MTLIVILPGSDGTGDLLREFVAALGKLRTLVIAYPADQVLSYEQLAEFIRPKLPTTEPYYLLGESFGGPLAILLAAAQCGSCAGVILCASFVRYPATLRRALAPLFPPMPVSLIPLGIMSWFLLGRWSTPVLRAQLARALASVSPAAMRARVRAALYINVAAQTNAIRVPLLYLQATHDRIVPNSAGRAIAGALPQTRLVQVVGPHFLLQVAPQACAAEVRRFVGC